MDKLLTKKDVAEILQVDISTVNRYISKGTLTPIKSLDCIRFNFNDIEQLTHTDLEPFSATYKRKLERELEEVKRERDLLREIVNNIFMESSKILKTKE